MHTDRQLQGIKRSYNAKAARITIFFSLGKRKFHDGLSKKIPDCTVVAPAKEIGRATQLLTKPWAAPGWQNETQI